jgi:hypothetical protein
VSVPTSRNYLAWVNPEGITLTSQAKLGATTFRIPVAKRRAPGFKELAPSGGVYTSQDLVWLLPSVLVTAAGAVGLKSPKPGDLITDNGQTAWTILECPLNTLKSTFRCMTRDIILAYDLRDTLTLRRPPATVTTDAAGGRTYSESDTVASGVACRFQEQRGEVADERGKRVTVRKFFVWVGQRLYPTVEDQVVDEAGNVYEVTGWGDVDRIDFSQRLECELRWPSTSP